MIDDTYYYGKNVGKSGTESIYYVSGLGEVNATFHTDTNFVVSGSLFDDKILDFAPLTEPDGFDTLIDDGVAGRSYLIGIGGEFEVFVARIGTDGAPESYAVLKDTTVDWGNGKRYPKANSARRSRIRAWRAAANCYSRRTAAPASLGWSCLSTSPLTAGTAVLM